MRKLLLAGFSQMPPIGIRLGLTLLSLVIGGLNLVFLTELWPHTPAAQPWLLSLEWLLLLTLPPQFIGWAWRWLRAYTGPTWVRLLAAAGFLGITCLGLGAWLSLLVAGIGAWLWA